MNQIKYKSGYKYQVVESYKIKTEVYPEYVIRTRYLSLDMMGWLTVWNGYCYDGPSGITYDSKNSMRGALTHDAFYQLLREGHLKPSWREQADKELYRILREDGMSWVRAKIWYKGVRIGARFASLPKNKKEVLTAP